MLVIRVRALGGRRVVLIGLAHPAMLAGVLGGYALLVSGTLASLTMR